MSILQFVTDGWHKATTSLGIRASTRLGFVGLSTAGMLGTVPAYVVTRLIFAAVTLGTVTYGVHRYNEGVRETVRVEYETKMANAKREAQASLEKRAAEIAAKIEQREKEWEAAVGDLSKYATQLEDAIAKTKTASPAPTCWTEQVTKALAGPAASTKKARKGLK